MDDKKRIYHLTELKFRRRDLRQKSTEAERILWERLRNNKLGVKFRRQYSAMGYVIDFYCPEYKFGIEIEGKIHLKKSKQKYDEYREEYLKALGIKLIKFTNEEVSNEIEKVIDKIKSDTTP